MSETKIDVSVERVERAAAAPRHPNTCPRCGSHYRDDELEAALYVCSQCGFHFRMPARARIAWLADAGSFREEAAEVRSADPLNFFDLRPYRERLAEAELNTGLPEAIIVGSARLDGHPLELAVMDFSFLGGSMGSAVGEKFVRACDAALAASIPVLLVSSSGGARMQEGILSLMQLPKTISALDELHDRRPDGERRLARRRHDRGARGAARVHRPPRRPVDHQGEAPRRLRPRRAEPAVRPDRRDPPPIGAAALPGPPPAALWQVSPSAGCGSG
jgi:predicted RNA-binding Zn-ribbon protein involved in translation (DUF1610 family)